MSRNATFFCHHEQYKKDTLSQHFVTYLVSPLHRNWAGSFSRDLCHSFPLCMGMGVVKGSVHWICMQTVATHLAGGGGGGRGWNCREVGGAL